MDRDNITFSSKIQPQVEDICFDIICDYFADEEHTNVDEEHTNVYVTRVMLAQGQIIFFVIIDGSQNIIRVPV